MPQRNGLPQSSIATVVLAVALAVAVPALAATGDVYRVASERANLRSAPGDESTVRTTLPKDEQLVELRTDGKWLGVRVLTSGEEGWIYSEIVDRVSQSNLGGTGTDAQAGFRRLSTDFDRLVAQVDGVVGYPLAAKVEQDKGTLHVTPTPEWLYSTGREAKLYAATALYEMWKNYNNGRPVEVQLGAGANAAIVVADGPDGQPVLRAPQFSAAR